MGFIKKRMNDYYQIFQDGEFLTPHDTNAHHQTSVSFLKEALLQPFAGKTVVVTHHVPFDASRCQYPFEPDLNEAFHANMEDLMEAYSIAHWIYGHNHLNQPSFELHGTQIHTNQLGYVHAGEHDQFRYDAHFTV